MAEIQLDSVSPPNNMQDADSIAIPSRRWWYFVPDKIVWAYHAVSGLIRPKQPGQEGTYPCAPGAQPYVQSRAQGAPQMTGTPGYPGAVWQQASPDSLDNTAFDAVKRGLHKVKISRYDATQFERQLQGELFDEWCESCEVVKATKIPISNIKGYLDHLHDAYEGVDQKTRKKMDGVFFTEGEWEHKLMEWKFNKNNNSGARYGMIAFGRSADKQFVDCMFVMYNMDFKITPNVIVTEKKHSVLFGLFAWQKNCQHTEERSLGTKTIKTLQNFFRNKALEGFYKEGIIEEINYVKSLDEIPDV